MKPVLLRHAAERDIENGFTHYLQEAGSQVAIAFLGAVDAMLHSIEGQPGSGSPRYKELLDIPNLRSAMTNGYPYILFYIERDEYLDALRLLHQHSDIPAQLS